MNARHRRDHVAQWMLLQRMFGIGSHRSHLLCERYGNAEEIFSLSQKRLEGDDFFSAPECAGILKPDWSEETAEIELAERFGATILTPDSPEYPESLRNIHSMPLLLYTLGDLSLLNGQYFISMVGSRKPNEYGYAVSRKLAGEIASLGGVVVSGLALGIDALCHRAALEQNGKTIALLAAGLDVDYPRLNRELRELIERFGLVMTEYSLGSPAHPHHFPVRNRMLSGLSMATVIVQCREHSGTMITAGHALSQGRDLFAVPDSILSAMNGGNALLLQGAEPALSGAQILLRYPPIYGYPLLPPKNGNRPLPPQAPPQSAVPKPAAPKPAAVAQPAASPVAEPPAYLSSEQGEIYRALSDGPKPLDALCERCTLPAGMLLSLLTQLELFGLVRLLPGRIAEVIRRV